MHHYTSHLFYGVLYSLRLNFRTFCFNIKPIASKINVYLFQSVNKLAKIGL